MYVRPDTTNLSPGTRCRDPLVLVMLFTTLARKDSARICHLFDQNENKYTFFEPRIHTRKMCTFSGCSDPHDDAVSEGSSYEATNIVLRVELYRKYLILKNIAFPTNFAKSEFNKIGVKSTQFS